MTYPPTHPPSRRGGATQRAALRVAALVTALVPLAAFSMASRLEPSSNGLGTHQQLGLPPCSTRLLLGMRCPACGMTTAWAHFTRGQWLQSFQVNSGGFLLAWFGLLIAFLAMQTIWTARLPSLKTQQVVTMASVAILLVTLVDWAIRLAN